MTELFLLLVAVLLLFILMVALNGVSESKGFRIMGFWGFDHLFIMVLAGWAVRKLAGIFLEKWSWSPVLTVAIATLIGAIGGSALSFVSMIATILLAGVR